MPLLNYPEDMQLLIAGCRCAGEIMGLPGIAGFVDNECSPGAGVQTDEEWENYLRDTVVPCYHPVGTCRMGGDARSVVNNELRVRGATGLRIVDASIVPRIPSGNTNAAAIMIEGKASDLSRGRQETCT
jgi:choline dehydrogenase